MELQLITYFPISKFGFMWSIPSNPAGPERSRAVPSGPERSRAVPSGPERSRAVPSGLDHLRAFARTPDDAA